MVILATSMAISLPLPMAMLTSACASAPLSLMPSPTIATVRPCCCSFFTSSTFSSGNTPPRQSLIPKSAARAAATFSLSPVQMATSMPMLCNCAIASLEVGFILSVIPTTPSAFLLSENSETVCAASISRQACCFRSAGITTPFEAR